MCLVNAPEDNFPFNRPLGLTKSQSAFSSAREKFIRKASAEIAAIRPRHISCAYKKQGWKFEVAFQEGGFLISRGGQTAVGFSQLVCVRLAFSTNCCYIRYMYKIHYVQSSTTKISVIWSHCKINVCAGQRQNQILEYNKFMHFNSHL